MTETRISISLTVLLLTLAAAAMLAIQPYSVRSPWTEFDAPGHRFLSAALRHDSAELRLLGASPRVMEWALGMRRDQPQDLSTYARFARAETGVVRSDTAHVLFDTGTDVCPLVITFVGRDGKARVLEAKPQCDTNRRKRLDSN
jgi:hypothetical protein